MKCFYYLAPSLESAHKISDDLHEEGVNDWFLHIISKDEAGLQKEKLHSSNWFETTDLIRLGFMGANIGFISGVILTALMVFFKPFGPEVSGFAMLGTVVVPTLFGAWVGGLTGMDSENRKLRRFHDDIEGGKYLILIYVHKGQGETVKAMMRQKHPESTHRATDRHFINPFSRLRRRK